RRGQLAGCSASTPKGRPRPPRPREAPRAAAPGPIAAPQLDRGALTRLASALEKAAQAHVVRPGVSPSFPLTTVTSTVFPVRVIRGDPLRERGGPAADAAGLATRPASARSPSPDSGGRAARRAARA